MVSRVHVAGGGGRYGVSFSFEREETEFGSGDVRARLDWVDGKWVSAEEKVRLFTIVPLLSNFAAILAQFPEFSRVLDIRNEKERS